MTADVLRRPPGEPTPDLTDYHLVHRAMVVDLDRLTLVALDHATPELAAVLREVTDLLVRHVVAEERAVFPLITAFVGVADHRRLQQRFRAELRLTPLPFLLPWVFRHATDDERQSLLRHAGWPVRVLLRIVEPRFRAREELLFG